MILHSYAWGDPAAPAVVCLHGVNAHGLRYRRLAERLAPWRRLVALDLRGHGRSGWEPPWDFATHDAWLLLRSLRTLELRVRRQSESATEIARRLVSHPAVERVLYPGLGDEIAARYMVAFGGLLSFQVRGGAAAARAVELSVSVIKHATSFGGVRSSLETRHRWEPRVPENLIRLSVGLEDVADLWLDLDRSLEAAHRPTRRAAEPQARAT